MATEITDTYSGPQSRGAKGAFSIHLRVFHFLRRWPVVPLVVLSVLVLTAIFAEQLAPHSWRQQSLPGRHAPPYWLDREWYEDRPRVQDKYILGTDHVGRDVLSRMIHGARISLLVVAVALTSGLLIGVSLGLISGWFGGVTDEIVSRFVDIWYALPFLLIALVVIILFGQSLLIMMIVLAMTAWVTFVRNVRAEVYSIKDRDYVLLSKIAGAGTLHMWIKHVMPGLISIIAVVATLSVGSLILTEATLSFLGAGIPAPTPAWGVMIAEGREHLRTAWWSSFFPGLAIFLVVMSLNFFGDWLRDRLDSRLRQLS
ncbi:MAG: ABC transporter permease [Dehalococcoidia bacterium]